MKKMFLAVVFISTVFLQNSFAQDSTKQSSPLLAAYYQLKDNLVKTNAADASSSAGDLVKAINEAAKETVSENFKTALLKDANTIVQSKDIKVQREKFASLSDNMIELAKTVKLSSVPVYQQYCPMKKASWLSNEQVIKNPYYGNAMLTCGSVKATL